VTDAPRVVAISIVKGDSPDRDRTWLTLPDGPASQLAVHVVHDLPHLVVESLFGIDDGLWGVFARGGFGTANRARTMSRSRRARLVTDVPLDKLGAENWTGHVVAKAATNAVVNRWGDGPDTAQGVRARLAATAARADQGEGESARRIRELAARLDDATIERAITDSRQLSARWAALPQGEMLRLQWPLHASD
jgi:hypothetical protein